MSNGSDVIKGIFDEALIWLIKQNNGFILAVNPNTTVLVVKSFSLTLELFSHPVKVGISIFIKVVKDHKPEQVKAKEQEIIDFAEIGEFIDMPVRTYSSGMYSKLAFSITAILETDIMLIDEVLSVGDQKFKKKSYEKMKSLISNKDRTVVIVSHSIETLKQLCDTVMWMHEGQIKRIGDPDEVLDEYVAFMEKS